MTLIELAETLTNDDKISWKLVKHLIVARDFSQIPKLQCGRTELLTNC